MTTNLEAATVAGAPIVDPRIPTESFSMDAPDDDPMPLTVLLDGIAANYPDAILAHVLIDAGTDEGDLEVQRFECRQAHADDVFLEIVEAGSAAFVSTDHSSSSENLDFGVSVEAFRAKLRETFPGVADDAFLLSASPGSCGIIVTIKK